MAEQKPKRVDENEPILLVPEIRKQDRPGSSAQQKGAGGDSISLIEATGEGRPSAVRALGAAGAKATGRKSDFKRAVNLTGKGATRCRLFYSKIAVAPLEHMEAQINDWLDNEEVEVKQVGQMIGNMVGKTSEPNLIVMVWY